jgi:hypothetical protein
MGFCGRLHHLTTLKVGENDDPKGILRILSSDRPNSNIDQQGSNALQNSIPLFFPALCSLSILNWDFKRPFGESDMQTSQLFKLLFECLEKRASLGAGIETMDIRKCAYFFKSGVKNLEKVVARVTWDNIEITKHQSSSEDEDEDEDEDGGEDEGGSWDDSDDDFGY